MRYEMEELVPVVGKLAEAYTAGESTSVTYEKAEQLLGAVLYAIEELERSGHASVIPKEGIQARKAYEMGRRLVEEKVRAALDLYNKLLPVFSHYGNQCLYDTFVRGLPVFFQRYDTRFEPQNSILILDYPVLKDISGDTGIDQIYEFIRCVGWEQKFLRIFPERAVMQMLWSYNRDFRGTGGNVCEGVLWFAAGHMLAGKPFAEMDLGEQDARRIQEALKQMEKTDRERLLRRGIEALIGRDSENDEEMTEYLCGAAWHT